jgi:putative tryptophan/tyrosine transport system substrate-binding protein
MKKAFYTLWFLAAFIMLIGGVCFIEPDTGFADTTPTILLLNSDTSVVKYRETQDAFLTAVPHPVIKVNLGDDKVDIADIQDILYDEDPDVIYCIGSKAYLLANQYAPGTPIVFSSIINWLRMPVTDSTYGVSNELHAGMELMLFRYIFPNFQKFGVLYSGQYTEEWFTNAKQKAKEMGVELVGQEISKKRQVISSLKKILPKVDAFWLISDPEIMSAKEDLLAILEECDARQIPVLSYHEAFAEFGATMTVTADNPTIGGQAASIVTEVLSENMLGEKVQFPAGTSIVLNMKKVKAYNLEYSEDALLGVNRIIE